jgi:hypothetical protein
MSDFKLLAPIGINDDPTSSARKTLGFYISSWINNVTRKHGLYSHIISITSDITVTYC